MIKSSGMWLQNQLPRQPSSEEFKALTA